MLSHLANGMSDEDIADSLRVSMATVQKYVRNVLSKLGARSRTEAAVMAMRKGVGD